MRPIKLIFGGLNSFTKLQTIDFESLSSKKIFGIFGNTGSGKSTILDAITLALYGRVMRSKLKTDFINTKTKETEVTLIFAINKNSKIKQYEVWRKFKMRKNAKECDSSAILSEIKEDGKYKIAENSASVDGAIKELMGLSLDEFTKCIALPQGEFAGFLKARPNERIDIIGSIFDLKEYGNELWEKVRDRVNELENKQSQLLGTKIALGTIDDVELSQQEKELVDDNKKLQDLNKQQENCNFELQKWNNVFYKIERKNQIIKRQAELHDQAIKIESDKKRIQMFDSNKDLIEISEKISDYEKDFDDNNAKSEKIKKEIDKLEKEVSQINNKCKDMSESYIKLQVENSTNLEKFRSFKENEFKLKAKEIELERLKKTLSELAISQVEIDKKIKLINDKKLDLLIKIEQNDKKCADFEREQLASNKTLANEVSILKNIEQRLQNINNEQNSDNKQCENNIKLANDNIKSNELLLEKSKQELGLILDNDKDLTANLRDLDKFGFSLYKAKLMCEALDDEIKKYYLENDVRRLQIQKIEEEIDYKKLEYQKAESECNNIEQVIKKQEEEKEGFIGENFLSLLVDNVKIGESCPVCRGEIVQKNIMPKSDVSGFYDNLKLLYRQKKTLDINREKIEIKIYSLKARIEFEKEQINSNIIRVKEVEKSKDLILKKFVDLNSNKYENFEKLFNDNDKLIANLEKFMEIEKSLAQENRTNEENKIENATYIVAHKEITNKLVDFQSYLLAEIAEKELQLYNRSNDDVDVKQKILEQDECLKLQKEYLLLKENIILEENELKLSDLDNKNNLNNIKEKIENVQIMIEEQKDDFFLESNAKLSFEDYKKQLNSELNNMQQELLRLENEYKVQSSILQDKKAEQSLLVKQQEFDQENINKLKKTLAEQGLIENDDWKTYKLTESEVQQLLDEIKSYETEISLCETEMTQLEKIIGDINISKAELDNKEQSLKDLQNIISDLTLSIGKKTEAVNQLTNSKEKLIQVEADLKVLNKKLDIAQELQELIRGKKLMEYVAEEFIDYITNLASSKLQMLLEGRYELILEEREFIVIDNFNSGEKRSVNTLSGGETFLVSLSLALAMSDSIIMLSNHSMDFFFLDEGFGTLDKDLCETVIGALNKLAGEDLTIGLISHIPELEERISNKLKVIKDNEKDGSIIKFVTEL